MMRLQIFLLSLSLVGLSGSAGQAPSPMGYASVALAPGLRFVANQFKGESNTVARVIPEPAEGTELYTFSNGVFKTNKVSSGFWTNPGERLEPGEGAIVFNPTAKVFTGTFKGELLQGDLINRIPPGLSLKSSLVPQVGEVTSTLGLRLSPFDNVYKWKINRFEVYTYLPDGSWFPSEPRFSVAEAFFIRANQEINWFRTFRINQ